MFARLPPQFTAFIGRNTELRELESLIENPVVRLISLLGSGGVGKTRLALAAAAQELVHFEQNVYFLSLLPIISWRQLALSIAQSIGFELHQETAIDDQLIQYLHDKHILIVLDNFEHLSAEAGHVSGLLAAVPGLTILVTSRERLNLRGEVVFLVSSFEIGAWNTVEEAVQSHAVQLFIQSAQRVEPHFALTPRNLAGIKQICQLVEGMPLGIELAAAWIDTLSPDEIADEIEHSVQFLEIQFRDLSDRHRSMWATFQSSWERLSATERASLSRMSIFSGEFTRKAAQAIANTNVRTLQTLINKSLLTHASEGHYRVHNLLRQYLASQLDQEDAAALRSDYCRYYLGWLRDLELHVKGKNQREALDELEREFDNLNYAWNYAVEDRDSEVLDQAVEALFWFCMMRSRYLEGEALLKSAEDQLGSVSARLYRLWLRRWREGIFGDDAIEALEALQDYFQQAGDGASLAKCQLLLGDALRTREPERSVALMQKSLAGFEAAKDNFYSAWALHFMSRQAEATQGLSAAIVLQEHSLNLRERQGDFNGVVYALYNLSVDWLQMGDLSQCEQMAYRMAKLSINTHERSGELLSSSTLSLAALFRGDFEHAAELNAWVRERAAEINHPLGQTYGVLVQGLLELMQAHSAEARTLFSSLDEVVSQGLGRFLYNLGLAMAYADLDDPAALALHLQKALQYALVVHGTGLQVCCLPVGAVWAHQAGDSATVALIPHEMIGWLEGWLPLIALEDAHERAPTPLSPEQAAKNLLQGLTEENPASQQPTQISEANQRLIEPLSSRELEVLSLIAQGMSNQEIAQQMVVEVSTVKKHITNIYGKLGVTSRTQSILRAQELGLV